MFRTKINPIKIIKLNKLGLAAKLLIAIDVIKGTNELESEDKMRRLITINIYFL